VGRQNAAPVDSIVELTRALVQVPSRAGIDAYEPVLELVGAWLRANQVPYELLADDGGHPVCVLVRTGERDGPTYLLDATVDTAPFGDESAWTSAPLSAELRDGWLYGRGAADSKVAVAMFCHLAQRLASAPRVKGVEVAFAFDADEHTGAFTGMKSCVRALQPLRGGAIGYPGDERLLVGSRGFLRARVRVHGIAAHSGSSSAAGVSAVRKAAQLVTLLERSAPSASTTPDFPLEPKVTVTGVRGGGDFSVIPATCTLDVDVRLTPAFGANAATALLAAAMAEVDRATPESRPCVLEEVGTWPAYRIASNAPFVTALRQSAREVFGRELPLGVAGPSNIGNFLAQEGVEMTCGFGVRYRNVHAPDEAIELASVEPAYRTYAGAVELLSA
jgi:succinyl-diaminopimelate desuccinylase